MSNPKSSIHKQSFSYGGESVACVDSSVKIKTHLHSLFELIDKEIDLLITENASLKERVETLEEILINSGQGIQPDVNRSLQQKFSVSSVKRDSMVAASQLSQKIKSTYKLKTSSKIFKGQSNSSSHLIGSFEWHKDGIWHITSSQKAGKNFIATASADGTATICDVSKVDFNTNLSPLLVYAGHQSSVNCIKFHYNNDLMITASGDGTSHIWRFNSDQSSFDGENLEEPVVLKNNLLELSGHSNVVISCDWISGADQCVTASWDHTANIYDYHTGELILQLSGHDQELTDVCTADSSRLIATSSHDTTFRLWDFRDAIHSVNVFQGHTRTVTSTVFLGNDKIISGGDDRNVKVWDLRNMRSPLITISMESSINKLSVSQQHSLITIPLDNRNVRIYDINGNRICRLSRDSHSRMVTSAAWINSPMDCTFTQGSSNMGTNIGNVTSPNSAVPNSNSINLFTCAFDRRVCAWSIVNDNK